MASWLDILLKVRRATSSADSCPLPFNLGTTAEFLLLVVLVLVLPLELVLVSAYLNQFCLKF